MPKRLRYTDVLGLNSKGLPKMSLKQMRQREQLRLTVARNLSSGLLNNITNKNKNKNKKNGINKSKVKVKVKGKDKEKIKDKGNGKGIRKGKKIIISSQQNKSIKSSPANEYWNRYHEIIHKLTLNKKITYMTSPNSLHGLPPIKQQEILKEIKILFNTRMQLLSQYSGCIPTKDIIQDLIKLSKGRSYQYIQIILQVPGRKDGFWAHVLSKYHNISFHLYRLQASHLFHGKTPSNIKNNNNNHNHHHTSSSSSSSHTWFNKTINKQVNDQKEQETTLSAILKDFSKNNILFLEYCDYYYTGTDPILNNPNIYSDFRIATTNNPYRTAMADLNAFVLSQFQGEFVVHLGELFGNTYCTDPSGRTTSMKVQIALAKKYHKIYECALPQWPGTKDTFSVWRRNSIGKIGTEEMKIFNKNEYPNDTNGYTTEFWKEL